jgi:hypothetical protein
MKSMTKVTFLIRYCVAVVSLLSGWYLSNAIAGMASTKLRDGIILFLVAYCIYTTLDGIESMISKLRVKRNATP